MYTENQFVFAPSIHSLFTCYLHPNPTHFSILNFPPCNIARSLTGEVIQAQKHDEVTMLFSDIVGFTSICSTATPLMVINMLQSLYTQFDAFCGHLDVYKVRQEYEA